MVDATKDPATYTYDDIKEIADQYKFINNHVAIRLPDTNFHHEDLTFSYVLSPGEYNFIPDVSYVICAGICFLFQRHNNRWRRVSEEETPKVIIDFVTTTDQTEFKP